MNIATKIRAASPVVVAWDADPRVKQMFGFLREMTALHHRMTEVANDDPATGIRSVASEIGSVTGLYVTDHERGGMRYEVRANGGAASELWRILAERRDAWIDAQLQDEGFPHYAWSDAKFERRGELADLAGTVEAAWLAFGESGK